MLYDALEQWTQINAHTSDCVIFAHLLQSGHNGRVKCKFLIDFHQSHLALDKLLADYILLVGPQIEVLAESDYMYIKINANLIQLNLNLFSSTHCTTKALASSTIFKANS